MKVVRLCAFAMVLMALPAWSQSLKPESPAPLQPGLNKGTADNFVGTQYWYVDGLPGKIHVHAQFMSMGLLGNASPCDLTVTLYDEGNTWRTPKILHSVDKRADYTFEGELKKPTKVLISVAPPSGGLVRMGGEYELDATGAVSFGQKSTADPIVGTYNQMAGYTKNFGACKFLSDGTIMTASGEGGSWKIFDKDSQMYVINIDGQERHSLQYRPGQGLCDNSTIIFQSVR